MRLIGKSYLFFAFALLFPKLILSVDIGSDSVVSRFEVQQILNDGDRVAGFAALEAGFRLANSGVYASWDSFFPVSGLVELGQAKLTLDRDLIFHDVSKIKELGDIVGNNHTMEFSSSITSLPDVQEGEAFFSVLNLVVSEDQGEDVEASDWSVDDKFIAIGMDDTTAVTDLVRIYQLVGDSLVLKDSVSFSVKKEVNCVRWHPSSYLLAIGRDDAGSGQDEFIIYEADSSTGVLTKKDGVDIGAKAHVLDWHPTGNWVAVGQVKSSQEVAVYAVDSSGNINSTPVASIDLSPSRYAQPRSMSWDSSGNYLVFGTNATSGVAELLVYEFNQATPSLSLNASVTFGLEASTVDWNKTFTTAIAVGLRSWSGDILQVYEHDAASGTLTKKDGISDFNVPVRSVGWNPQGDILAVGLDPISGDEFRVYSFNGFDFSLSEKHSFPAAESVESTRWSPSGRYVSTGDDGHYLSIYEIIRSENTCVTFYNLNIFLNQDLYLKQECLHFSGESMISGRGNCLTLAPTCSIIIDRDSSLMFKDITIKDIHGNKIQCQDSSSTVSFHDVEWVQDGDFTFTVGKIDIMKDWILIGEDYTFAYQTDQISTVSICGRLIVENNMTFSYDPPTESKELIRLLDDTSEIILNGGVLHTTAKGMTLKTGKLIIDRESALSSEGTVEAEALNLSLINGLIYQELPAANVDFFGYVVIE